MHPRRAQLVPSDFLSRAYSIIRTKIVQWRALGSDRATPSRSVRYRSGVSQTTEQPPQQHLSRRLRFQRRVERFLDRYIDEDLKRVEVMAASENQRVAIFGIIA